MRSSSFFPPILLLSHAAAPFISLILFCPTFQAFFPCIFTEKVQIRQSYKSSCSQLFPHLKKPKQKLSHPSLFYQSKGSIFSFSELRVIMLASENCYFNTLFPMTINRISSQKMNEVMINRMQQNSHSTCVRSTELLHLHFQGQKGS